MSALDDLPPALVQMRLALTDASQLLIEKSGPAVAAVLLRHEADAIESYARYSGQWDDQGGHVQRLEEKLRAQLATIDWEKVQPQ